MGKAANVVIPEKALHAFDRLVARFPDIERKGKTSPYTSLNGHMFAFLGKEGVLGIRLGDDDHQAFVAGYGGATFIQYGAVMKNYVSVPNTLLMDTDVLVPWFEKSVAFVKTLKPK